MDSSRNGLLSTLLMTLPLIVVPAIALLRPPGQSSSVSTNPLDASEEEDSFLDELSGLEIAQEDPDAHPGKASPENEKSQSEPGVPDINGWFEEDPGTEQSADDLKQKRSAEREEENPFQTVPSEDSSSSSGNVQSDNTGVNREKPKPSADKLVEQLNALGAVRTMWFSASEKTPVGFAAFFRGDTETVRIRFEAVGQTREECAQSVLNQVTRWQAAH